MTEVELSSDDDFGPCAPALKPSVKADGIAMQGRWEARSVTFHGLKQEFKSGQIVMTLTQDELVITPICVFKVVPRETVTFGLEQPFSAKVALSGPNSIDLRVKEADDVKVLPGSYKLEGDVLYVCFTTSAIRPTEFTAAKRSGNHLFEFQRPSR